MLKNHPVLLSLKAALKPHLTYVEGLVQLKDNRSAWLLVGERERYRIAPEKIHLVANGDRIAGVLESLSGEEYFIPKRLKSTKLSQFIAQALYKQEQLWLKLEASPYGEPMLAQPPSTALTIEPGDWVMAKLTAHPLKQGQWQAEVLTRIASKPDPEVIFKLALARQGLPLSNPSHSTGYNTIDQTPRTQPLQSPFFTIDGPSTRDLDDALCITRAPQGGYYLTVAVADPTAYVDTGACIEQEAAERGFTHYLPAKTVTMLPVCLSEDLCALQAGKTRLAVLCTIWIDEQGTIDFNHVSWSLAHIRSEARLEYQAVSDWLERGTPIAAAYAHLLEPLNLLAHLSELRRSYRLQHQCVEETRREYSFQLDTAWQVTAITAEPRRIAHRMVEEAMLAANLVLADTFTRQQCAAVFSQHAGFDEAKRGEIAELLNQQGVLWNIDSIFTLSGYHQFKAYLQDPKHAVLAQRIKRFHLPGGWSTTPSAHFGLGVTGYATWTSPLRKYGDFLNHRIIKALLLNTPPPPIPNDLFHHLEMRRRQQRLAEREVCDQLYLQYFRQPHIRYQHFQAEVTGITHRGAWVQLIDNGARCFLPILGLTNKPSGWVGDPDQGWITYKEQPMLRIGDHIQVKLAAIPQHRRRATVHAVVQDELFCKQNLSDSECSTAMDYESTVHP